MKIFVLLLSIIIWSCSPAKSSKEDDRKVLDSKLEEIKVFIAESNCDENDSCQVIAVGSKACGGPKTYMTYSSAINIKSLKDKIEAYNRAETEYNKKHNIASDCALVNPPETIGCEDGNCMIIE